MEQEKNIVFFETIPTSPKTPKSEFVCKSYGGLKFQGLRGLKMGDRSFSDQPRLFGWVVAERASGSGRVWFGSKPFQAELKGVGGVVKSHLIHLLLFLKPPLKLKKPISIQNPKFQNQPKSNLFDYKVELRTGCTLLT